MSRLLSISITWTAAAIASIVLLVVRWGDFMLDGLAMISFGAFFMLIVFALSAPKPRGTIGTMGLGVLGILLAFILAAAVSWISALAA